MMAELGLWYRPETRTVFVLFPGVEGCVNVGAMHR
jgi:hypothetical protein